MQLNYNINVYKKQYLALFIMPHDLFVIKILYKIFNWIILIKRTVSRIQTWMTASLSPGIWKEKVYITARQTDIVSCKVDAKWSCQFAHKFSIFGEKNLFSSQMVCILDQNWYTDTQSYNINKYYKLIFKKKLY